MARRRTSYYDYYPQFSQPSVSLLRQNAEESIAKAGKRGKTYHPVSPKGSGSKICVSWWGQAWCTNMERYADYANRLPRGKRYVASGTVLDLEITQGQVQALVQGSRSTPYRVTISIDPLSPKKQEEIIARCNSEIKDMEDLIYGRFPESLKELFLARDGLFPSPRQIHMNCSCPDWATMCKHVAAVMYGIGIRLDDNPFYFFSLRGADVDSFVASALEGHVESMLKNADKMTDRVLPDSDITELFGVL